MTRRKICVVTTSRAEFGLFRGLLKSIRADRGLRLQVIASGMHLAPEFGLTVREIEDEGFKPDCKIDMQLTGMSGLDNAKSIGLGLAGFADALAELEPAIVVLLGDRFEIFAPAIAALMIGIPIAHIHGGERTEGAIDESVRHAITKMASLHFPATEAYRRRIIQMGESPKRVFNFGAPGSIKFTGRRYSPAKNLKRKSASRLSSPLPSSLIIPPCRIGVALTFKCAILPGLLRQASSKLSLPWPMRMPREPASMNFCAPCANNLPHSSSGFLTWGIAVT